MNIDETIVISELLNAKFPDGGSKTPVVVLKVYNNPPLCPWLPLVPAEPLLPEVPLVPDVPLEPSLPDVPLVPDEPSLPEVPLVPLEPSLPEVPLVPLVPLVAALNDVPFKTNEPLILTEPVNSCVSFISSPNLVEPLENDIVKYDIDELTINCCAVKEPVIVKSPFMI